MERLEPKKIVDEPVLLSILGMENEEYAVLG